MPDLGVTRLLPGKSGLGRLRGPSWMLTDWLEAPCIWVLP